MTEHIKTTPVEEGGISKIKQIALNSLLSSASAHGDRHGNDAHIEALESLLTEACSMLTAEQWAAFTVSFPGKSISTKNKEDEASFGQMPGSM